VAARRLQPRVQLRDEATEETPKETQLPAKRARTENLDVDDLDAARSEPKAPLLYTPEALEELRVTIATLRF
jgi:hypothetical protein